MHADVATSEGAQAILASALARGVPVISALQLLKWLDGRNGSFFSGLNWSEDKLTFDLSVAPGANGLQVLLPTAGPSGKLQGITRSDDAVRYVTRTIKGIEYAIFPAGPGGKFQATYSAKNPD